MSPATNYTRALADLIVRFGANVQPGQLVAVASEPGKEQLVRAIADSAYQCGALFVDLNVFDIHLKRARALYADPKTLDFVPPWYGQRVRALGEHRSAMISLTGPAAPRAMEGIDPDLVGKDMLPRVRESIEVVNERTTNWTVAPCPSPGWARLVHGDLDPEAGLARLWGQVAHVCRLGAGGAVAAWRARMDSMGAAPPRATPPSFEALDLPGPR